MKTKLIVGFVALAIVAVSTTTQAQRRQGNNRQDCILQDDLTQEQKDKLDELRVDFYKQTQADHNQLNELMARKHTLETTNPVDKKALYDCLASINSVQTKLQKERVRHFQDVKANMTDEQIIVFDSRNKGRMHQGLQGQGRNGKGYGNGQGPGKGQGFDCAQTGQGFGQGQGKRGDGQRLGRGQGQGKGQRGRGYGDGQGQGKGQGNGIGLYSLDLTDAQKEFMDKSRLQMLEKEQGLKNKLNELDAQLKTKTTGKNIDLKQVDKLINEQSEIRLQMAQLKADHRMEVRSQLTDEQKIAFDSRPIGGRGRDGRY
ncbi:Spy/CpxP family protein refolding chaperone [Carboxylicivirga caseinilyticus]|uniref:Spy/CpxP family protein refolding chaperone n=1 Tax=Carboxylicivirga caseinilyticus TaxID=3417572 RepID=UPI003D32A6A5|nr:periplasmic heavy metal sensor [Marinilabiliaceae bacterium A049]